eukprot:TRINITY_DN17283_c0_g1_i1.p1 TRINITY_DN17283_c0_g1~~TRINITY_DN17283_c0_g1_i1.p1  ORF type:complete len:478 (-),score=101.65 TRINITY_DN17283_c0_g1_i1:92-1375(-)
MEAQGQIQGAFQEYKRCLAIFEFVWKWENNPRIKDLVRDRMEDVMTRAEELKARLNNPQPTAQAGSAPARTGGTAAAMAPQPHAGGSQEAEDHEDKEKQARRKGLEGAILTEKPNIKWDDVAGLLGAKEALQETVILPTTFPQLFQGKRQPWHGILLYGPPGTGKSFLAKACATEADATFFSLSSSDLVSKWMGESEQLVRTLFEMARESKPAIVFIDEVDSICGARGESGESEAARRIKTEFLTQMDGVGKESAQLLVLGATNTPWDLDTAIRRRFEKRIYIPLPEEAARITLLKLNIGDTRCSCTDKDLEHFAQRTDGFSGADMSILVRDAIMAPVRRCRKAKTFRRITKADETGKMRQYWCPCEPGDAGAVEMALMQVPSDELLEPEVLAEDFEIAVEKAKPSVNKADLMRYTEWTEQFGTEAD